MSKAFIVASINVTDPDCYEAYVNEVVKVTKEVGVAVNTSGQPFGFRPTHFRMRRMFLSISSGH